MGWCLQVICSDSFMHVFLARIVHDCLFFFQFVRHLDALFEAGDFGGHMCIEPSMAYRGGFGHPVHRPSKSSPSPLGPAPESIIKVGVVLMRICAWPGYLWVAVHAEVARTSCKQQQLQLRHRRMPLDIPRVGHLWSAGVKIKNKEWNTRLVIFGI